MATEIDILLKAVDEASAVLSGAADKIRGSMGGVEEANTKVDAAQKKTDSSCKDLVTGFSGVATGAFALYMTVDRVEKSQFALEKANLAVTRSNESLDQAQKNVTEAIAKYGVGSAEAKDASDKLAIAQDAFALANDRASLAQGNVNQAMLQGALTIVPTLITIVSSAKSALGGMEGAQKLLNMAMEANPIMLIVAAIGILIGVLVTLYLTCEPVRNAIDGIGRFLGLLPPAINEASRAAEEDAKIMGDVAKSYEDAARRMYDTEAAQSNFTFVLGKASREISGYDEILNRNCLTLEDYRGLSKDASDAVDSLSTRIEQLKIDCDAANAALQTQITNLELSGTNMGGIGRHAEELNASEAALGDTVSGLNAEIDKNNTSTETAIADAKALQIELEAEAKHAADMADLISGLSDSYNVLQAQVDTSLGNIHLAYDDCFAVGNFNAMAQIVADFAVKHNISLDDAKATIEGYTSALDATQVAMDAMTVGLLNDWNIQAAQADVSLGNIHAAYDDCFAVGNFDAMATMVRLFAQKHNISLEEAKSIIDSYVIKVAEIPETIEEQLVGRAQADLETFKNCASGKFATIEDASSGSWNTIVKDTNDLISSGLIGQAQANIKAFVDCSTGKQADMVDDIDGYLKAINTEYADALATAYTLVNKGKDKEAKLYFDKATGLNAKIQQLEDWRNQILGTSYEHSVAIVSSASDRIFSYTVASMARTALAVSHATEEITGSFRGMADAIVMKSIVPDMMIQLESVMRSGLAKTYMETDVKLKEIEDRYARSSEKISGFASVPEIPKQAIAKGQGGRVVDLSRESSVLKTSLDEALNVIDLVLPSGAAAPAVGLGNTLIRAIGGSEKPSISIQISAPLVNVEGSADRATAELAASMVEESLRNVIVEASSSGAPSTSKMVRYGNRVTI